MDIKEIIEDAVLFRKRRTEDVTLNNGTVGELTANVFVVGPYEIRVSVILSDNETGNEIVGVRKVFMEKTLYKATETMTKCFQKELNKNGITVE